jgi:hypothetical protein
MDLQTPDANPTAKQRLAISTKAALRKGRQAMRTFDEAKAELQKQSLRRGFGGGLEDVEVVLAEDHRHGLIFSHYSLDAPLVAGFDLPAPVSETNFDADEYMDRLLDNRWRA